jgi:ring-1,2-phenylacetyl-CoA epoxidase subunit PaaE
MTDFHPLRVAEVRRETDEATSIAFEVPAELTGDYAFVPGQYLTLKAVIDGHELRRSYSICSGLGEGELRVAVKQIPDGRFSGFANSALRAGDTIEVLPPQGRFSIPFDANARRHYVGLAGGSGITPFMSIIKSVLKAEPKSEFTLFYGNRTVGSIIFRDELEDLKDRYLGRLRLFHVLSDEIPEVPLFGGLMSEDKIAALLTSLVDVEAVDYFLLCGPGPMTEGARHALAALGVPEAKVKSELFGTPPPQAGPRRANGPAADGRVADVTLILNGITTQFKLPFDGEPVLDTALANKVDLPFACKGGVCCTCKAKLLEGRVTMDVNYGLEAEEIEAGYILTCQSRPQTDKLVIDFDH